MAAIDDWITAHGLDTTIDNLIRTCGFDRVRAALKGAPDRFAARGERLLDFTPPAGPGAPQRHDVGFYEALCCAVMEIKRRHALDDKAACHHLARDLAKLSDQRGLLVKLGLDQAAGLTGATLYRAFKRGKPTFAPRHELKPAKEQADLRGPPKGQK